MIQLGVYFYIWVTCLSSVNVFVQQLIITIMLVLCRANQFPYNQLELYLGNSIPGLSA